MSESGVIPPLDDRHRPFTETGSFTTSKGDVLTFGTRGSAVVLLIDWGTELNHGEQDRFARELFAAMRAAEEDP